MYTNVFHFQPVGYENHETNQALCIFQQYQNVLYTKCLCVIQKQIRIPFGYR